MIRRKRTKPASRARAKATVATKMKTKQKATSASRKAIQRPFALGAVCLYSTLNWYGYLSR